MLFIFSINVLIQYFFIFLLNSCGDLRGILLVEVVLHINIRTTLQKGNLHAIITVKNKVNYYS
jgi:hypothetical protein